MKKITMMTAVALALAVTNAHAAMSPLRVAVISYFASNEYVQAAVAIDVCTNDGMMDSIDSRKKLRHRSQLRYDLVRNRLGDAYQATEMTDGVLEQVRSDFCNAIWPK